MDYLGVLRRMHESRQPQTYLEIGVGRGKSLRLSQAPRTVGVDPHLQPAAQDVLRANPGAVLFGLTSDAFFSEHRRESVLQGSRLDLAFIDGLHRFDQVLRDFINVERWCASSGAVIVHDVIPASESAASRAFIHGAWSGDVWQIVSCLRDYRPDLECMLLRTPPSGLLIVRNLDPSNDVLTTNMEAILRSTPRDGESYQNAVRHYLANLSAAPAQDALDRLFTSTPAFGNRAGASRDQAVVGAMPNDPEPHVIQTNSDVIPSELDALTNQGGGRGHEADEPPHTVDRAVRFEAKNSAAARALDPNDFRFYGFDDRLPEIEQAVRSVGIRSGPRAVTVVENAILVPGLHQDGGVLDGEGHVVPAANMYRKHGNVLVDGLPADRDVQPESELDAEVVYLGGTIDHFGHFLLEGMARCWMLSDVDPTVPVAFQTPPVFSHGSWRTEILKALGVTEDRVLPLRQPTRIRRLIIPEPLFELSRAAHEQAADSHRLVATHILHGADVGQSDQPVYLSRRLLSPRNRFHAGESQLEDILRVNGFLVVYPETMTLKDQFRLFNGHTDIFAPQGSAAHAILFALNRPRMHLLTGLSIDSRDYFLTMALAGAQGTVVNGLERPGGLHVRTPVILDLATVTRYLADQGLLKKGFTAHIATNSTVIRTELEENTTLMHMLNRISAKLSIPEDVLVQATALAKDFWPLSLLLAYHESSVDSVYAEDLARQFMSQVASERNLGRLIKYREIVLRFAPDIATRCSSELAEPFIRTVEAQFAIDLRRTVRVRERRRDRATSPDVCTSAGSA